MVKMDVLLDELASFLPHHAAADRKVTAASVGWHIEHCLLTINRITEALKRTRPDDYRYRINFPRLLVFTLGKIPRGRAKAPRVVQPGDFDEASLQAHLLVTREKIKELEQLPEQQYFDHPYFGQLKTKPTQKFLIIHTRHHLSIIKEILKKTNG